MKKFVIVILLVLLVIVIIYISTINLVANFIHPLKTGRPLLPRNKVPIPPILYKTGPDKKSIHLKNLFKKIIKNNPSFTIKYFDNSACRKFITQHFTKKVLYAFDNLLPGAYKADLWRYCVLYQNGGVYGDLTQQYMVPLDQLIDRNHDRLVLVKDRLVPLCMHHGIQISFMAAVPKLPVFMDAINMIVDNVKNKNYGCNPSAVTGPNLFRTALDRSSIPFRLELVQKGSAIKRIDNGKLVIKTKLANHNKIIKKNIKNNYVIRWLLHNVFKKD